MDIPRDRKAEFEPKIVKKYETVCNELDKKVIGLYSRGMSLDIKGRKDILGIWVGEHEGAKFWLSVCNDLKNRGVKDIVLACMDVLK